jgi:hypothetical protein
MIVEMGFGLVVVNVLLALQINEQFGIRGMYARFRRCLASRR